MSKKNVDLMEEMLTEVTNDIEVQTGDKRVWKLDNGEVTSRSKFVRQEFEKGISRTEISEKFDIGYQMVYQACQNMTNGTENTGNRGGAQAMITVDDKEVSRNSFIQTLADEGKTRKEIKELLEAATGKEVTSQVIYNATKDLPQFKGKARGNVMITVDGKEVKRTSYIIERFTALKNEGKEDKIARRAILDELKKITGKELAYQVVYNQTSSGKSIVNIKANTLEELEAEFEKAKAVLEAHEKIN